MIMRYEPQHKKPEEILRALGFNPAKGLGWERTLKQFQEEGVITKNNPKFVRLHAFIHHGLIDMHAEKSFEPGKNTMIRNHPLENLYREKIRALDVA
jgi:hypothetical protein